ncbi:MAG TPA: GntR family transcriptional regulator [Steroidobacter sp.]|uniref:GntR family transcriptional regulator n=1 Tax=Steroidobacter sp. TaxID=1978227 RepID=UPI002ED860DB
MAKRKQAAPSSETEDHSKAERVYHDLRRRIRDLRLPPGTRLDKNEMSLQYGVSRAPLGEAILRLATEGLVDVVPQSGSYVAAIRPQDIRDSLLIRTGLEVEAVRRIAQTASDELLKQLDANVDAQAAAIRAKDMDRLDDLDAAFHTMLMEAVGSPRALQLLDGTRAVLDRPRYHALPVYGRPNDTLAEHRRIVDAIRTRDPELAGAAMRIHLTMVAKAIEGDLAKFSDDASPKKRK